MPGQRIHGGGGNIGLYKGYGLGYAVLSPIIFFAVVILLYVWGVPVKIVITTAVLLLAAMFVGIFYEGGKK